MNFLSRPSSARWMRFIQEAYYSRAKLKAALRTGVSIEVRNHVDWCLYNDIFVDGEYDRAISDLLRANKSTLRVLDLGCNVGFFVLRILDRLLLDNNPKTLEIAAVEPDDINVAEFRRRLSQQTNFRDGDLRCEIAQGLAGKKRGSEVFFHTHSHHAGSVIAALSADKRRGQSVDYIDVSTRFGSESWDLIKCDIEGAEKHFVDSYPEVLAKTGIFVVELHHGICELEDLAQSLNNAALRYRGCLAHRAANSVHMFSRD